MHGTVLAQGAVVWIRRQRWRVERVRRERNVLRLDVTGRQGRLTFLSPFDRPSSATVSERRRRVRRQAWLARLAGQVARSADSRTLASAVDARIDILPYQLEPALAVLHGARRVLIADAVGLGKTIQAGLIIAELLRRRPSLRALVIVPSALRPQWADELRDHFEILTCLGDAGAVTAMARASARDDRIWDRAGVWLSSIDYLKQPHVLGAASRTPWDVLVIDEAHGVCGDSLRFAAAGELARRARRIVLLTATPHNGDSAAFARLLGAGALIDERIECRHTRDITVFRRTRDVVGLPSARRVKRHAVRVSGEEARLLDALMAFEHVVLGQATDGTRVPAQLLLSVFRKRALSTMAAFNVSIDRRLAWRARLDDGTPISYQGRLDFDAVDVEDDITADERASLTVDVGLGADVERSWLRRLRELGRVAARRESKARFVVSLLERTTEPVVIFTEFRDSLCRLLPDIAVLRRVSVLHGGLTPQAQQEEIARFLSGHASVLLTTDVACQGLNLQRRCRWIVNLELPWNPLKLEQRAGRVDRIGQTRVVHVSLLIARHESERDLLARLSHRASSAEQELGGLSMCERWRRSAPRLARRLARRRELARRWRSTSVTGRPAAVRPHRIPAMDAATGGRPFLAFVVPIVDGLGSIVERHVLAVAAPENVTPGAIRATLAQTLTPRIRRLSRLRREDARSAAARERAIHDTFARSCEPGELQPGLFDRRELRRSDRLAADRLAMEAARDEELARLEAEALVEVGTPSLAFVIEQGEPEAGA